VLIIDVYFLKSSSRFYHLTNFKNCWQTCSKAEKQRFKIPTVQRP